ncbi:response regulator [Sulfuricurvum sp.]|uniref:response regulator n=1 Tax=Sulfuricurvum sp. TaxID=2025608 RepID=UPI002622B39C|nr:response regulator [Sulfuricurvum sp.]MDD4885265.1 response regulator [Sulfuricurvum sp.]
MNILIIENEIYLAQSIASKLSDLSHNCDISSSTKEGLRGISYDVILLSTNISGQDIYPVIEAYKNAVVILMVSYISNDTVSKPLAAGAKDYILKPFMIEELIRKIQHFQNHERLKRQNQTYERYLTHTFNTINVDEDLDKIELPLFICSGYQKYADAFAFRYAAHHDKPLQFISLSSAKAFNDIAHLNDDSILYITDFQNLKKSEYKAFYDLIASKECIIASTDPIDNPPYRVIEIESDNHLFDQGEILPIEEYVKYIMIHFQNRFPDTELSKKLGISRKSLWEKRKKYGIVKKK